MLISNFKRIVIEDFSASDQALVNKLAFIINPMIDQLQTVFHNNVDFDNLNQQLLNFDVTVDSSGKPTTSLQLSFDLNTRPKGLVVIQAVAYTNNIFATGCPFISYTANANGNINVQNIAGLPANQKFNLQVIIIG